MTGDVRAWSCGAGDARSPVPLQDALRLANEGVVVLVEGALGRLGYLRQFEDLYFDGIAELASPELADDLRHRGLRRMHELLTPGEIATLLSVLDRRAKRFSVPVAQAMVELTSAPRPPHYFICSRTWVRAQVPYRLVAEDAEILSQGHLYGHLVPTTPHRDVDLTHPRGTLSIWAAIGPICAGNTVELFDVGRGPYEASSTDPALSVRPVLAPGDVLIFNADRLHTSVRNETDDTRVSVGARIVVGRALQYGPGTHWRAFYDAQLVGTKLDALATLQSRCSTAAVRRWWWRRGWEQKRARRVVAPSR